MLGCRGQGLWICYGVGPGCGCAGGKRSYAHVYQLCKVDAVICMQQLLGKEAVDEFIASAWKRSVTEIDVVQEKTTTPHLRATALYRPDGNYGYSHNRFNALGPVLQCPPSIFSKFGEGDDEKIFVGFLVIRMARWQSLRVA